MSSPAKKSKPARLRSFFNLDSGLPSKDNSSTFHLVDAAKKSIRSGNLLPEGARDRYDFRHGLRSEAKSLDTREGHILTL